VRGGRQRGQVLLLVDHRGLLRANAPEFLMMISAILRPRQPRRRARVIVDPPWVIIDRDFVRGPWRADVAGEGAPGDELREPERAAALLHLRELAASRPVTLLTATKDLEHSQAMDLAERLRLLQQAAAATEDRGGDPVCWLPRVCPRCGAMTDTEPPTTCPQCGSDIPAS
jgi:predicted Zn-ribbon and HTH transcriptional regulator